MNCTGNCTVCLLGSRASVKAGSLLLLFSLWTRVIGMHLTEQGYYLTGLQSLYTHLPIFAFSPCRVLSELRGSRGQKSVLTLWWNYFTGKQKNSYLMYCWVHSLLQKFGLCYWERGWFLPGGKLHKHFCWPPQWDLVQTVLPELPLTLMLVLMERPPARRELPGKEQISHKLHPLFWSTRTRDSTPANANNSVLAKNPSRSWVFWRAWSVGSYLYQPWKTIRVSEILKMNPMLRYFLSLTLKLASNHRHISSSNWCEGSHSKGTLMEFLSRIILTRCLSHGDQSFLQYFYNVYLQVYN